MLIFDVCFRAIFVDGASMIATNSSSFYEHFGGSGRVRDFLLSFLALSGSRTRLTGVIFHSDTMGEGEGRSATKRETRRDRGPLKRKRGSETSWLLMKNPISPLVSTPTTT